MGGLGWVKGYSRGNGGGKGGMTGTYVCIYCAYVRGRMGEGDEGKMKMKMIPQKIDLSREREREREGANKQIKPTNQHPFREKKT